MAPDVEGSMKTVVVMKRTIIHHCENLSQFHYRVLGTLDRGLWTHCSSVSSPPKWGRSCSACVAAAVLEMAGVAGGRTPWISPLPPFQPRATHAWTAALAVAGDQFHSSTLGGVNCGIYCLQQSDESCCVVCALFVFVCLCFSVYHFLQPLFRLCLSYHSQTHVRTRTVMSVIVQMVYIPGVYHCSFLTGIITCQWCHWIVITAKHISPCWDCRQPRAPVIVMVAWVVAGSGVPSWDLHVTAVMLIGVWPCETRMRSDHVRLYALISG